MTAEYLTMQEVKDAELHLLCVFDSFCRDNNLRYSLASGTMLGAVRHKGFIPWDDDIDIDMPVEDYKVFLERFPSRAGADRSTIGLASHLNLKGSAAIPFEKLVDTSIEVKSAFIAEGIREYVWLDIFPVVTFGNEAEAIKAYKTASLYKTLFQASRWSSGQAGATGRFKAIAGGIARRTPLQRWAFRKLTAMTDSRTFSSAGVAANLSWAVSEWPEIFSARLFDELIEYEFEGSRFYGFKDFDSYLSPMYGDYMTPPPVDKQVTHKLKAWRVCPSKDARAMRGDSNDE